MLFAVSRRRTALWCLANCLVLLLICTLPLLPLFLMDRLESTYPPFSVMPSGVEHTPSDCFTQAGTDSLYVLVLGAGGDYYLALPPGKLLSSTQMVRLAEGIRVVQLIPEPVLVTSALVEHSSPHSQAELTRLAAQSLGYTDRSIQVQGQPKITCEEARSFVDTHGRVTRVLLVTSATHMRRAMALFTSFGAKPWRHHPAISNSSTTRFVRFASRTRFPPRITSTGSTCL
jgi:uncharacterized SAM-binding protein YcdF (DUF218 family)